MNPKSIRALSAAVLAACLSAAPALAQTGTPSPAPGTTDRPSATTTASRSAHQQKLDRSDKKFIEKAAQSGVKEHALSQLAAERASNQRVREYAQQLMQDHQQVNEELVRLAQSKGVEFEGDLARLQANVHGSLHGTTPSTTNPSADARSRTATAGTRTDPPAPVTSAGAGTAGSAGSPQRQDATRSDGMLKDRDLRRLSDATGRDFDERYVKLMIKEHEDAVKLFEKAAADSKDQEIRSFASQHVGSLREHLQEAKNLERAVAE